MKRVLCYDLLFTHYKTYEHLQLFAKISSFASKALTCEMPVIDRFHCHATKTKLETVQWEKP